MNTRNAYKIRAFRSSGLNRAAPVGMAQANKTQSVSAQNSDDLSTAYTSPVCNSMPERICRHPLTNMKQNAHLARCEESITNRFDFITPVLKRLGNIQHDENFVALANSITTKELDFVFPLKFLESAWISGLDMKLLYAKSIFNAINSSVTQFSEDLGRNEDSRVDTSSFFLDCGYHSVDITPCSDGRLKGLSKYILRLPLSAITVRSSYAGALLNVESNVHDWEKIELSRVRNLNALDNNSRYLKIVVYHRSSSDPLHQGCAAHGSNDKLAAEAGLEKLKEFHSAVENTYSCGSQVDILLLGVDTDNDSIRVHVPDSTGELSIHRYVDSAELYNQSLNLSADQARVALFNSIDKCSDMSGWGKGEGKPSEGMRKVISNLLEYNLSQIEYVADLYGGAYPDLGHAERYISVGDGFQEIQLRNIAYYAHLDTVEEGSDDLDIGVKIFSGLNIKKGLPIPIAIHYRYDSKVPGSRDRAVQKSHRVKSAILNRYKELAAGNNLFFQLSVQDLPLGSDLEVIDKEEL
ncbi:MAG: carboxysome shell carbonic anhydrase [Proteobacteria bacterium]|nr:carboxysome shell carbonic anhydrase [Pseudomonadota bacterium]